MKTTLTVRCIGIILALDVIFSLLASIAALHLLSIDGYSMGTTAFGSMALIRMGIWCGVVVQMLKPFERFARTDASARTPSIILAADQALQRFPLRFSAIFALLWGASFGCALYWLWSLGADTVPLGLGVVQVGLLISTATVLGNFAFAFPVSVILTTGAAQDCSSAAAQRHVSLERTPISLRFQISLLALCVGCAPTAWVMGLGYQKQLESGRQAAKIGTELAAVDLATIANAEGGIERLRTPGTIRALVDDIAGTAAAGVVLDRSLTPLTEEGARVLSEHPELKAAVSNYDPSGTRSVSAAIRSDRAVSVSASDGGYRAAVVAPNDLLASRFALDAGLFGLIVIVWAPLCAFILGDVVSGPIGRLTNAARFVVEKGKLTELGSIPIARDDEIGELSNHFNEVIAMMRSLGGAANAVARGDLRVRVEGNGELPDAFRDMLTSLTEIVKQIRETAVELASAAAEIFAAAQEQETAAAAQSSAMVEISRTMESLSASAAHVSEAVDGVLGNAERTLKNTDDMVGRIGALTGHANRIGEILEVIREIADRSDLLALNGSLEASRAGDSGRGFALVATEMRRLAERVTDSVTDVKKLVTDIRESGSSTVIATEESRKLADGTTEAARQITFVSQQQRSGTEQVSLSVKNVAEVVSQAASATSQTRTAAEGLKTHADRLEEIVQRFETIDEVVMRGIRVPHSSTEGPRAEML